MPGESFEEIEEMMFKNKFNKARAEYGVGEWAGYSYNIGVGCQNDCKYCYAKADALKYGNIHAEAAWPAERVNPFKVDIKDKADARVMFPSTHDITPAYLNSYIRTLDNMLFAGNEVLVVTKPRLESVREICHRFSYYMDKMEFRFTIGTLDDKVSKFWEPGAPLPLERLQALKHAYDAGFRTSVSMEPMLEGCIEAVCVYKTVEPFVNGTIWIGLMNKLDERVDMTVKENELAVNKIRSLQSDNSIMKLYRELKDETKVRWKDSIREVVKRRVM